MHRAAFLACLTVSAAGRRTARGRLAWSTCCYCLSRLGEARLLLAVGLSGRRSCDSVCLPLPAALAAAAVRVDHSVLRAECGGWRLRWWRVRRRRPQWTCRSCCGVPAPRSRTCAGGRWFVRVGQAAARRHTAAHHPPRPLRRSGAGSPMVSTRRFTRADLAATLAAQLPAAFEHSGVASRGEQAATLTYAAPLRSLHVFIADDVRGGASGSRTAPPSLSPPLHPHPHTPPTHPRS